VSERVYKKAFSHEKALEMIQNGECGTFNPLLLQCMTEAQDKLKTMMEVAEKE
jgi:putative two-component system response regulator